MAGLRIVASERRALAGAALALMPRGASYAIEYSAVDATPTAPATEFLNVLTHALTNLRRPGDVLALVHDAELSSEDVRPISGDESRAARASGPGVIRFALPIDIPSLCAALTDVPSWNETMFAAAGPRAVVESFVATRFVPGMECNLVNEAVLLPDVTAVVTRGWDGTPWSLLSARITPNALREAVQIAAARLGVSLS